MREQHPVSRFDELSESVTCVSGSGTTAGSTAGYIRPKLEFVGTVTHLVQSGPLGNRNETYQGSYWSDHR
jgi:hypothetical protein